MDFSGLAELLKIGGTQALMLAAFIWYLNEMRKGEEKRTATSNETLKSIIDTFQKRESENTKAIHDGLKNLLSGIIDTQHIISGTMSRTEQKIDTNWSCPLVKEFHRDSNHYKAGL